MSINEQRLSIKGEKLSIKQRELSINGTELTINQGLSINEGRLSIKGEKLSIKQRELAINQRRLSITKSKQTKKAAFLPLFRFLCMEHTGFEPVTPSLPAKYSPTELMPRVRQIYCSMSKYF